MAALSTVSVSTLTTFVVNTTGGNYQSDPTSLANWAVEMTTTGDQPEPTTANFVSVIEVTKLSATQVQVKVHPEMSAGKSYRIKTTVKDDADANLTTNFVNFLVPATLTTTVETLPLGMLEALFMAFGETMDYYQGRPTTQLVSQVNAGATDAVYVETTLGFPWKGAIWVGDSRVRYENKTDGAFLALTWDELNQPGYGEKTKVMLDTKSVPASDTITLNYGTPDWTYLQDLIDY
jgi:hypothetical protein